MDQMSGVFAQGFNGTGSPQLDSWIAIAADGTVTAYTGKCEFGQGLYTAQMQLVAEELVCAAQSRAPDPVRHVDDTGSGHDIRATIAPDQLQPVEPGARRGHRPRDADPARRDAAQRTDAGSGRQGQRHRVKATPSRRVSYGALIGGKKFDVQLDPKAARIHPRDWTVLGTPVPRVDMRAMATGEFEFVHNVRVPGMLHGRVVRPPSPGATVMSVDESSVRGMPGLVKVVVKNNFVGVVAEQAVAGDANRRETARDVDARSTALAAARRLSADQERAVHRHAARGLRRCGQDARICSDGAARDVSPPVSDARLDWHVVRRR